MAERQLLDAPGSVADDALDGLCLAHPDLIRRDREHGYVVRAEPGPVKVALVSGGGSGHEPLHAGFVGRGMLDAAVPGAVFASPTAVQIEAATAAADRGRGVVHIVKNYTGDVLNFSIAGELAGEAGITLETVLVDDDLATDGLPGPGRRGTAAVVAVEKICGAAAERGASPAEVAALGRRVVAGARSMALALTGCTRPGGSGPSFELGPDEVEFGVGIHGERGIGRRPFGPAAELVEALTVPVVQALELGRGDRVIAIVNGLGATPPPQLLVAYRNLAGLLTGRGVTVARSLVGPYVTALDMAGFSVTLVRADDETLSLWDAPVRTPALTW
ncbi:dihydroxyacetone kinase subunit DhaK [Streptosporangium longisporum]|uniref:Dihydroxyacetone kinase subunit DhaK n=1 Tax=Streptosporangium longisporum TaxID=46187 RepID=A0ABN3XRD9_9ACTN